MLGEYKSCGAPWLTTTPTVSIRVHVCAVRATGFAKLTILSSALNRSSSNRKRIGFGAAASDTSEIIVGLVDGLADVAAEEIPVCVAETLFAARLQRTTIRALRHRRGKEVALQRGGVDDAFRARGAEHLVDGFEVYGCEGADVEAHFLEGRWVEFLRFCCDGRFLAHDDLACRGGVCGE